MSVGGFEVPDMSNLLDEELDSEEPRINRQEKSFRRKRERAQAEKDIAIGRQFRELFEGSGMSLEEALAKAREMVNSSSVVKEPSQKED